MNFSGSNVKGGIGSILSHNWQFVYRLGLPGIVLAFVWGLYNPKPTYHQNQNNPLKVAGKRHL